MTRDDLIAMKERPADVPCGSCRACCTHDVIRLRDDELERFAWHREGPYYVLDRKADGSCIYLTERGCSVHDDAPDICRRFDCRVLFLTTPKARRRERVAQSPHMRAVYEAGKRRADTLRVE